MSLTAAFVRTAPAARLRIGREDLRFAPLPDGRVLLEFDVHNDGDRRSAPASARVSFAPFGAFLTGMRVGEESVPAIPPRGRATVRSAYSGLQGLSDFVIASLRRVQAAPRPQPSRILFAGNFDVFVRPGVAAERHCATLAPCAPGARHLAEFAVGQPGGKDAFRFEAVQNPDPREVELLAPLGRREGWGDWHEIAGTACYQCGFRLPAELADSGFAVEITRRSSGVKARVEFGAAHGAAVSSWTPSL